MGRIFVALLMTMIACQSWAVGIPTAAVYITAAVVAAPAIINMGPCNCGPLFCSLLFHSVKPDAPPWRLRPLLLRA
jgi:TRAP-type uncharacterized transport system fused permease subunit